MSLYTTHFTKYIDIIISISKRTLFLPNSHWYLLKYWIEVLLELPFFNEPNFLYFIFLNQPIINQKYNIPAIQAKQNKFLWKVRRIYNYNISQL